MADFPVFLSETVTASDNVSTVKCTPEWDNEADFTNNANVVEQNPAVMFQDEINERIDATISRNNANDGISKGINGSLSSSDFIAEFDIDVQSVVDAATQSNICFVIFSSSDSSAGSGIAQNFVGMSWNNDSNSPVNNLFVPVVGEGIAPINGQTIAIAVPISVARFGVKITKSSPNSATVGLYSDATKNPLDPADFLGAIIVNLPDTVANLQQFKILNQAAGNSTNVTEQFTNFVRLMYNQSFVKQAYSVNLQENVGIAESISVQADHFASLAETTSINDAVDAVAAFPRDLADSVSLDDAIGQSFEYKRDLPETIHLGEGLTIVYAGGVELDPPVVHSNAFVDRLAGFGRSILDSVSITETSIARIFGAKRQLAESTEISESLEVDTQFQRNLAQSVSIQDQVTVAVLKFSTKTVTSNLYITTTADPELNL